MSRASHANGTQKQATFKRAYDTVGIYISQGNHLAAYVVTFSIIEDRVRALFVEWHRFKKSAEPTQKQINGPFSNIVTTLAKDNIIAPELSHELTEEAKRRNSLMHSAMWNLDAFTEEVISETLGLARDINNAGRRAKTKFKK